MNQSRSVLLFVFLFISSCRCCSSLLFLSLSFSNYKSNGATLTILSLLCVKVKVKAGAAQMSLSKRNQQCCNVIVLKCSFQPITTKHSRVLSAPWTGTPPPQPNERLLVFCQVPFFQHPSPHTANLEVIASLEPYSLCISQCAC